MIDRWFDPLPIDHPLVGDAHNICPVCRMPFQAGDVIGLLPTQLWGDDGPQDMTIQSIPIHKKCYMPQTPQVHDEEDTGDA